MTTTVITMPTAIQSAFTLLLPPPFCSNNLTNFQR